MTDSADLSERISSLLDPRLVLERVSGRHVILSMKEKLSTADRGKLLLDTEKHLRNMIDQRLEVFLDPQGDLNKLRQRLRGVGYES